MLPYQCLAMLQQENAWHNAPQLIFVSDMCRAPCYELHLMCSSQAPGLLYSPILQAQLDACVYSEGCLLRLAGART